MAAHKATFEASLGAPLGSQDEGMLADSGGVASGEDGGVGSLGATTLRGGHPRRVQCFGRVLVSSMKCVVRCWMKRNHFGMFLDIHQIAEGQPRDA